MKTTRLLLTILCLLLAAAWLGACSDDDTPTDPVEKDTTPPQIIYTDPEDGRGGVGLDDILYVVFNEGMNEDSSDGNVTLTGSTITGTSWETNRVLTIEHATFAEGATITLTVGTGLEDAAGNALAEEHSIEFLTTSSDLILMSMTPADASTGVPVNSGITLQFSESMNTSEIEQWVILTDALVTKASGPDKVNFAFAAESLGNDQYLLAPDSDLPAETLIYVYVSDQIQSYAGHSPVDPYLYSFTTGTDTDTTPPTVVSVEPANGTMNVDRDQGFIRFTFSEPINDDSFWIQRYNLGFMILMEFSDVGFWEWNGDFTTLTIGLPSDLPAGAPLEFTIEEFADMNGVVQDTPYTYEVKVAGSADYLPFVDGRRYREDIDWEEGILTNPTPQADGYRDRGIEIDFQTGDAFREVEYDRYFNFASGAWEAYRERSSALEWLGWEDEVAPPLKSNDFDPPLTVAPLPFAPGTWTDSGSVVVDGEGTYTGTIEGRVLAKQDYVVAESGGEAFIKDAWIVVFDLEAELGGEPAVAMHDTVIYAAAYGPVLRTSYEANLGEGEWRSQRTWRWPWYEFMSGPRKSGEFPRLRPRD